MKSKLLKWLPLALLAGCAGLSRDCSSGCNSSFGADWIVVQFDLRGKPFNCWRLPNVSMTNEPHSDGIFWQDRDGHLVHISGWYNRIQVQGGNWKGAGIALGVDADSCKSGYYTGPSAVGAEKYEREGDDK